jgi:hypothetical protein
MVIAGGSTIAERVGPRLSRAHRDSYICIEKIMYIKYPNMKEDIPECKKKSGSDTQGEVYSLTPTQWKFLIGEHLPNKSESAIRQEIKKNKIQKTDRRFDNLFADIAAYEEANILTEQFGAEELNWEEIWEAMLNIEPHTYQDDRTSDSPLIKNTTKDTQPAVEFGLEYGRIIRLLSQSVESPQKNHILLGFLYGLTTDAPISGMLDDEKYLSSASESAEWLFERVTEIEEDRNQLNEIYQDIAEKDMVIVEELHKENITHGLAMHYLLDNYNLSIKEDGKYDQQKVADNVSKLIEDTNIKDTEPWKSSIQDDFDKLNNAKKQGQSEKEIFDQVIRAGDDGIKRTQINGEYTEYILEKLAGEEEHLNSYVADTTPWSERPLVKKTQDGQWKPTPYGDLLAYIEQNQKPELGLALVNHCVFYPETAPDEAIEIVDSCIEQFK